MDGLKIEWNIQASIPAPLTRMVDGFASTRRVCKASALPDELISLSLLTYTNVRDRAPRARRRAATRRSYGFFSRADAGARRRRRARQSAASRGMTSAAREAAKAAITHLARARPNLYELSSALGDRGIGRAFTKHSWRARPDWYPDTYWTLTKIKTRPSGRSGEAWGRLTWKGRTREGEERINGSVKPIWRELRREGGDGDARGGPRLSQPAAIDDESAG